MAESEQGRAEDDPEDTDGGGQGESDGEESACEKFVSRVGSSITNDDSVKFDITIIIAILAAVVNLVQNCPFASADRLRQRIGNKMLLVTTFKQSDALKNMRRADLRKIADKVIEEGTNASDNELKQFIRECKEEGD